MTTPDYAIALSDDRPYFEQALQYGTRRALLSSSRLQALEEEAAKGMVQIAATFGSKYLLSDVELARQRMVNLVSLYLSVQTAGDLDLAARQIRDQTFLTLSRGGSGLLKALFALPDYPVLAPNSAASKGKVEDFLEVWSLKSDLKEYHQALQQRQEYADEIGLAIWFAEELGLTVSDLQEEHVEANVIIRTALLQRAFPDAAPDGLLSPLEFAQLLETMRKLSTANLNKLWQSLDLSDVPQKFSDQLERVLAEIQQQDMPRVKDSKSNLDKLVFQLKDRFYLLDDELADTSALDALVAKEWAKITKGKTDVDSLMSLFFNLALEMPAKTSITEKNAKSMVKKMREHGWQPELASAWIRQHAPHEKQEGLLEDWDNFVVEAENYLLDEWDTYYSAALRFLSMHCHIQKVANRV